MTASNPRGTRRQHLRSICTGRAHPNKPAALIGLRHDEIAFGCPRCLRWHRQPATAELLHTLAKIPEIGRTFTLEERPYEEAA